MALRQLWLSRIATIVVGIATIVVDCDNCEHCDNCDHINLALETQLELETMSIHNAKSLKRAHVNKYALQTPTLDEAK